MSRAEEEDVDPTPNPFEGMEPHVPRKWVKPAPPRPKDRRDFLLEVIESEEAEAP